MQSYTKNKRFLVEEILFLLYTPFGEYFTSYLMLHGNKNVGFCSYFLISSIKKPSLHFPPIGVPIIDRSVN